MLRTTLVALDDSDYGEAAAVLAIDWARRHGARLLGLPQGQGGRGAARTLQTFKLLGLAAGEAIEIVSIHRDVAEAEALVRIADDYLTAHRAAHHLHPIASDAAPADILLEQIRWARAGWS